MAVPRAHFRGQPTMKTALASGALEPADDRNTKDDAAFSASSTKFEFSGSSSRSMASDFTSCGATGVEPPLRSPCCRTFEGANP